MMGMAPQESELDKVLSTIDRALAQRRLRNTLRLADLEDEVQIARGEAELRKYRGGGGQVVDQEGQPVAGPAGMPADGLLGQVFGFFANQNLALQSALQERDNAAATGLRDELKAMREQFAATMNGGGANAGLAQLQALREAIKFQGELQADLREITPGTPVPQQLSSPQAVIAYEDAQIRHERATAEIERARDEIKEMGRQFNETMALARSRANFVMHLASQHLPGFVEAMTRNIAGSAAAPPPPPPPPPPLGIAASTAPAAPPPAAPPGTDLVATECPACHRHFGIPPGTFEVVCPYPDCEANSRLVAAGDGVPAEVEGFPG